MSIQISYRLFFHSFDFCLLNQYFKGSFCSHGFLKQQWNSFSIYPSAYFLFTYLSVYLIIWHELLSVIFLLYYYCEFELFLDVWNMHFKLRLMPVLVSISFKMFCYFNLMFPIVVEGGAIQVIRRFKTLVQSGEDNILEWHIITFKGEKLVEQELYLLDAKSNAEVELIMKGNLSHLEIRQKFISKAKTVYDVRSKTYSVIFQSMTFQDIGVYRLKVSFYVTLGGTMSMMTNFNKLDFNVSVTGKYLF